MKFQLRKSIAKLKRNIAYSLDSRNNQLSESISKNNNLPGRYERIYNLHIRKTGGTSLNRMFLNLDGNDGEITYRHLPSLPQKRFIKDKVIVGWNQKLIEEGNYFYAFSHIPFHDLKLPDNTYRIVCFRDPVNRVVSHYKMLIEESFKKKPSVWFHREKQWLGSSFYDFVLAMPEEHLQNQLYMFSKDYSFDEALQNVGKFECVFFTEDYQLGIDRINSDLNLKLEQLHVRSTDPRVNICEEGMSLLTNKLASEIKFVEAVESVAYERKGKLNDEQASLKRIKCEH